MQTDSKYNQFDTPWEREYWMESNGMFCGFNMPPALPDGETPNGLPPYRWRKPFLVDEYPACPSDWMKSEGRITSYFVPVQEGKGMWLDFNKCVEKSVHDIAIVISIQGINPITGLPCTDAHLEQYIDECPKHKEKFGPNRFCKTCGYKWTKQNYICTTGTPSGMLWLDGFRTADGIVRQYIMTQEKMRGVASNIIGKERVYAVGISFFLSKEKKKDIEINTRSLGELSSGSYNGHLVYSADNVTINYLCDSVNETEEMLGTADMETTKGFYSVTQKVGKHKSVKTSNNVGAKGGGTSWGSSSSASSRISASSKTPQFFSPVHTPINWQSTPVQTRKVEIGAGSTINQTVYDDPETLDFWRNEPESILIINYCAEQDCEKIVQGRRVKLTSHPEGFLQNVPVGNKQEKETVHA